MTYSIIARCPNTGNFGAAIASYFPAVGAHSPAIQANVGIIATQGWVNPSLGIKGMRHLREGQTANETLNTLLHGDAGRELRQLAILDRFGNSAVYTGIENDEVKGHIIGKQYAILGNLLESREVLEGMEHAFESTAGRLEEKLLAALLEGDRLGGDRRGKQSAILKVEAVEGYPYVDFRVDDAEEPVLELEKIYRKNKHVLIDRYDEWIETIEAGIRLT
ncbi:hypothetical protein OXB_1558 [Bacillus sp. OxB-1]|uniref:DUF1028 domain-containing protein n=1 Tax=Bacillus sp. (strain OxB-1) TaxID=98228 RepID=UPI0005822827|nr:DUF1028 domain-containing protein [Bacillus sp. OxB-1]BAQ10029.1 hypothetical protein OXB_1558 [Bacillus sp. OxB-1]